MRTRNLILAVFLLLVVLVAGRLTWSNLSKMEQIRYSDPDRIESFELLRPTNLIDNPSLIEHLFQSDARAIAKRALRGIPELEEWPENATVEWTDTTVRIEFPRIFRFKIGRLGWARSNDPQDWQREKAWLEPIPQHLQAIIGTHPLVERELARDEALQRELAALFRRVARLSEDQITVVHGWERQPAPPQESWTDRMARLERTRDLLTSLTKVLKTIEEPLVARRLYLPWLVDFQATPLQASDRALSSELVVREGFAERWNEQTPAELRSLSLDPLNRILAENSVPILLEALPTNSGSPPPDLRELTDLLIASPKLRSGFSRANYREFLGSASVTVSFPWGYERGSIPLPASAEEVVKKFEELKDLGAADKRPDPLGDGSKPDQLMPPAHLLKLGRMTTADWDRVRALRDDLESTWLPRESLIRVERNHSLPETLRALRALERSFQAVPELPEMIEIRLGPGTTARWDHLLPPSTPPRIPTPRILIIGSEASSEDLVQLLKTPIPTPQEKARENQRQENLLNAASAQEMEDIRRKHGSP